MRRNNKKPLVLELNNIDVLGRRFNGYDLLLYLKKNCQRFKIRMLVNNRLDYCSKANSLFRSGYMEECDWIVQAAEKKYLLTKNQISLAENAITNNPVYKKSDILHFHLYHNMNLPIEFLLRIPNTKKIIIDIHDTFWLTDKTIPMLEVFNYTNLNASSLTEQRKRILNNIDAHFVVHSPYMMRLFHKSSVTKNIKKVHFINFGINLSIFRPLQKKEISKLRNELGIPKKNIVLLCRAQKEFKGLDYIIEALKILKTNQEITIITVANTELLNELKNKYQIIDLGTIYNDKRMAEIFNISDIFLSPSTEESFGFMAAEAMACGKPVIVFEGTALPDTVNAPDIGIATKRDATSLSRAIKTLVENPEERTMRGRKGIEFAKNNYTDKSYYQKYSELFDQISTTTREPAKTLQQEQDAEKSDITKLKRILPIIRKEILEQKNLKLSEYTPPIVDYNNLEVQKLLYDFNLDLYTSLLRSHRYRHATYTLKRYIPPKLKKGFIIIRRTILLPAHKVHNVLRRKNNV